MNHPNNILNEDTIDKISKEIISQNEEFKELRNRINMIENEFNSLKNKIYKMQIYIKKYYLLF